MQGCVSRCVCGGEGGGRGGGEGEEVVEQGGVRGAGGEHQLYVTQRGWWRQQGSINQSTQIKSNQIKSRRRRNRGSGKEAHTESAPCLFFHGIQRGNLVARSMATASDVSTASKSGVSQSAFLLMPSSSWPASMRNSWTPSSSAAAAPCFNHPFKHGDARQGSGFAHGDIHQTQLRG